MAVNTDPRTNIVLIRATPRCDSCHADARVRLLVNKTNLPLLFCGFHYLASAMRLAATATVTHDNRCVSDRERISA